MYFLNTDVYFVLQNQPKHVDKLKGVLNQSILFVLLHLMID